MYKTGEFSAGSYYYSRKRRRIIMSSYAFVSVKFSSVIHLTIDNYYLRGFGFISISV